MQFDGDIGAQFTIHIADQYTVPELVDLAQEAERNGFDQVWVNDNLGYRNVFVVLTELADAVSIDVGTAILVPWYRNPIDVADTIAAITELAPDQEISIGLGRGDFAQTGSQVRTPKPYTMLAETTECIKALLDGQEIRFGDYQHVASYFNLRSESTLQLAFEPMSSVRFYMAGHGPTGLTVGGRHMDGLLFGGFFIPLVRTGRLGELLETATNAATEADPEKELTVVAEVNVSIAEDREAAIEFTKPYVAHAMLTYPYTSEDVAELGIDPANMRAIKEAFDDGETIDEAAELVTGSMVDAMFITGDINECREGIIETVEAAARHDIDQISLAKLGPDYHEALDLLGSDIIPHLRG